MGNEMDKAAIKQIVNRFSAELARMGIRVEQALLFGSQAAGFTPQEIASRKLMPFWEHILDEQASPV